MKKSNCKFYLAPLKLLTYPVICFKDPKAAILTLKRLQEAACDSVKAAFDKLILAHFPYWSQGKIGT
jgi:hypothetical protein